MVGLALGGAFALSGVSLVVLFRASGVLNLASGAIGAASALLSWSLINDHGVPEWPAFAISIVATGIITLVYGIVIGRALADRDPLVKAMGTLGLLLILLGAMSWIYGDDSHTLTLPSNEWSFQIGEVRGNGTQVAALALGILVTFGAAAFLRRSDVGIAMRALAGDREATAMLGAPVRRVEGVAWFVSGLLAGITGLLLSNLIGLDYTTLTFLVVGSLAAALIGRLQSLAWTLVGGLAIGVVQAALTPFTSLTEYRTMTPFVFAIVVLLVFAVREGRHAAGHEAPRSRAHRGERPPGRRIVRLGSSTRDRVASIAIAVFAALVLLLALPALASSYWTEVLMTVAIYSVVALSLVLLFGRVGMISLCQVAVLGLGGWIALRLGFGTSLPFPIVLLLTGVLTGAIGTLIGLPALRLRGLYFALITLMAAAAFSVALTATNLPNGGGGFLGYDTLATGTPKLRGPDLATSVDGYYRYLVAVVALLYVIVVAHLRTRAGRAWAAIRESEPGAVAAGINVTLYKLWAFALASFVTGVAGGLLVASPGGVTLSGFPTQDSLTIVAVALLAGVYNVAGAVVAGLFFKFLPALLDEWGLPPDLLIVLFGAGVLLALVTAPRGLVVQVPSDLRRLLGLLRRPAKAAPAPEVAP